LALHHRHIRGVIKLAHRRGGQHFLII
jgi:hypothetical protein